MVIRQHAIPTGLWVFLVLIAFVGCNAELPEVPVVTGSTQTKSPGPVSAENTDQLVSGINEFGCDLYRSVSQGDGNLFFSPHSLYTVLAMVYAGARGETEAQMRDTVHFELTQDELHRTLRQRNEDLTGSSSEADGFTLRIANSLWAQDGYPFLASYRDAVTNNYSDAIHLVDYRNHDAREMARKQINQWIEKETEGNIKDMLNQGILTQDTRLTLVNAIYFNALWVSPFNKPTRDSSFYLNDGEPVVVPMMSQRLHARINPGLYVDGEGPEVIELPYRGSDTAMLIIMPASGKFRGFEESLNPETIRAIRKSLTRRDTGLLLPKFEFRAQLKLGQTLSAMGMPSAFTPGAADFSGMSDRRDLFLAHLLHDALVRVEEKGTTAAAATVGTMERLSAYHPMSINRPFLFCILDTTTEELLFMGRVMDPRSKN